MTMRSGSLTLITAIAYAPSSSCTVSRTAFEQVARFLQVLVHAVRNGLGVRLRLELVPVGLQLLAQLLEILDDAVVHHDDVVGRHVRVRVGFVGHAMSRPAGMRNAGVSL